MATPIKMSCCKRMLSSLFDGFNKHESMSMLTPSTSSSFDSAHPSSEGNNEASSSSLSSPTLVPLRTEKMIKKMIDDRFGQRWTGYGRQLVILRHPASSSSTRMVTAGFKEGRRVFLCETMRAIVLKIAMEMMVARTVFERESIYVDRLHVLHEWHNRTYAMVQPGDRRVAWQAIRDFMDNLVTCV